MWGGGYTRTQRSTARRWPGGCGSCMSELTNTTFAHARHTLPYTPPAFTNTWPRSTAHPQPSNSSPLYHYHHPPEYPSMSVTTRLISPQRGMPARCLRHHSSWRLMRPSRLNDRYSSSMSSSSTAPPLTMPAIRLTLSLAGAATARHVITAVTAALQAGSSSSAASAGDAAASAAARELLPLTYSSGLVRLQWAGVLMSVKGPGS